MPSLLSMRKFSQRNFSQCVLMLFLLEGFVFFEGDAVVESLGAFVAFWEEVETDAADVLLGAEGLGIIYLFTLDFQLHHAPFWEAYSVAFAQMAIDDFCDTHQYALDGAFAESSTLGRFFQELIALDGLIVYGYCLVLSESL